MANLQKVSPGDKLKIPAETFNTFIDAARDYRQRQQNCLQPTKHLNSDTALIRVRNDSEVDCPRFGVLSLTEPIFAPGDAGFLRDGIAMIGVAPTGTDATSAAIAQGPIAAGRFGLAQISGVTLARVTGEGQTAAPAFDDVAELHCGSGDLQVLWSESGTGSRWAIVRLGGGGAAQWQYAVLDADLPAGGSCSATIYYDYPDATNNQTDTVYAPPLLTSGSLTSGSWVLIDKHANGNWYANGAPC